MSIPMTQLGSRGKLFLALDDLSTWRNWLTQRRAALHHEENPEVEREYDNLRALARAEADKRGDCYERVR